MGRDEEPTQQNGDASTATDANKTPMPVVNAAITFNKFETKNDASAVDFDISSSQKHQSKKRKLEQLIHKEEQKKAKLAVLKETNPEKAEVVEETDAWKKAIAKSEGVKIKDNVVLIKKTLKRREQQKKKSTKEWAEREEKLEEKKEKKQKKRRLILQRKRMERLAIVVKVKN